MKKFFLLSFTALSLLLTFASPFRISNAQDRYADRRRDDAKMAQTLRRLTDRSDVGLIKRKMADGTVELDLQERFQNVPLVKIEMDGDPAVVCATSLGEANDFFGRDLETGEILPVKLSQENPSMSRHEMTTGELAFYKALVADADERRRANPEVATVTIVNNDGAGEGFNDTTAKAPEGGNDGATLGEQRLNLFNFAAAIWGAYLDTTVPIRVNAQFNALECASGRGVLGSAGPVSFYRDFPRTEYGSTWYPVGLANKVSGVDHNTNAADINSQFNTSIDNGCLSPGTRFYYGLDGASPSGTINLLVVLLHEMGHGLGFASLTNGTTGAQAGGFPDVYSRHMVDRNSNLHWFEMTAAERQASALNAGNLLWDGPSVRLASGNLTGGRDVLTGSVQLYSPSSWESGSSISHWDRASSPNLLMEPSINRGLPLDLDLTRQQMRDIGWFRDSNGDLVPDSIATVLPSGATAMFGSTINITWVNEGGFDRNVTIEMSTDGGETYPTVVASDVPNTGVYGFTVPSIPTTQARFRVREYNFAAPASVSTNDVTFTALPAEPFASVSGQVLLPGGRGMSNTVIVLVDSQGETRTVITNSFGIYTFDNVRTGEAHSMRVASRRYKFGPPKQLNLFANLTGFNFQATE